MRKINLLVENLILLRLLPLKENQYFQKSKIFKDLEPLFLHRYLSGELKAIIEDSLKELEKKVLISRNRGGSALLTKAGLKEGLNFVGLEALPEKVKWAELKNQYLTAKALDVNLASDSNKKKFKKSDQFRAAVLRKECELQTVEFSTLNQTIEALAWKQLGVNTNQPFTKNAVLTFLLNQFLGLSAEGLKEIKQQITARVSDARNSEVRELRSAVLRRFIDQQYRKDSGLIKSTQLQNEQDSNAKHVFLNDQDQKTDSFSLRQFAVDVLKTARSCETGWFGEEKVFISHVWEKFTREHRKYDLTENRFKQKLIQANRQNYLALSSADLVEAMNSEDLFKSRTSYLNIIFHFIRV